MRVFCTPETPEKDRWIQALSKIECEWLIVSAVIDNHFMEGGLVIGKPDGARAVGEFVDTLTAFLRDFLMEHELAAMRVRVIEAVAALEEYEGFDIAQPGTWDVPFTKRLAEIKIARKDATHGLIYKQVLDRESEKTEFIFEQNP